MKIEAIKVRSSNDLVYDKRQLINQHNFLTKEGAENFLGILSTLLLNYTHQKDPAWLLERFDLLLENRFSLASSFRIYMMSLLDHKLGKEQKNILIDGLTKSRFGKNFIQDETLHFWLEENIIDEISFHRNLELGMLLIEDSSRFLSFTSSINIMPSREILSKIPLEGFEEKIIDILEQKIPSEKPDSIAIKVFLFNCLKYNYDSKNFPEVLILKFALEVKQNFLFHEKNFSLMTKHYKGIVRELHNQYGKNNDKGLNR